MKLDDKFSELDKALKHYATTGEVLRCLYAAFNEKGRFIPQPGWDLDGYQVRRIESQTLCVSDMVECDQDGQLHYLGSITKESAKNGKLHIEYTSIGGFVSFSGAVFSAPYLKKIGWGLSASKAREIDLPSLEQVGGKLGVEECRRIYLPQLKEVGGDTKVYNAEEVFLPKLEFVAGNFFGNEAISLTAPRLREVCGGFVAPKVKNLQLGSFKDVKDFIQVGNYNGPVFKSLIKRLSDDCLSRLSRNEDLLESQKVLENEVARRAARKVQSRTLELE